VSRHGEPGVRTMDRFAHFYGSGLRAGRSESILIDSKPAGPLPQGTLSYGGCFFLSGGGA